MLDEAIAKYDEAAINLAMARGSPVKALAWRALDAAVRDCMLVAAQAGWDCNCGVALDELFAEIRLGLPEGSEGGKDDPTKT